MTVYEQYLAKKKEKQSVWDTYREKKGIEAVDVAGRYEDFVNNHNTYINNYNARYTNTGYKGDTSSWLSKITTQNNNFKIEADYLRSQLSGYDDKTADNIRKSLDDMLKTQENIIAYSTKDDEYWRQWSDQQDYLDWIKRVEEYNRDYDELMQFKSGIPAKQSEIEEMEKQRDAYLRAVQYPHLASDEDRETVTKVIEKYGKEAIGGLEDDIKRKKDELSAFDLGGAMRDLAARQYALSPDWDDYSGYDESIKDRDYLILNNPGYRWGEETDTTYGRTLTDNEKAAYNYLYKKEGAEAAKKYLEDFDYSSLRKQFISERGQAVGSVPVLGTAMSVLAKPLEALSYVGQTIDYIFNGKVDTDAFYNSAVTFNNNIRSAASERLQSHTDSEFWKNVIDFGYQTGVSMADFIYNSLLARPLAGGVSEAAQKAANAFTLGIMGTEAAAESVISAKERGLSDDQAYWLGTIAGAAEIVTEKFSLDNLLDTALLGRNKLVYLIKNAFVEGSEEVASDVINTLADIIIAADKSELTKAIQAYRNKGESDSAAFVHALMDTAGDMGLSFLGGALSGGAMAGVAVIGNSRANSQAAKLVGDEAQAVIDTGLESAPDSLSYKVAAKLQEQIEQGKTVSKQDVGELYRINVETIAEENRQQEEAEKKQRAEDLPREISKMKFDEQETKIVSDLYDDNLTPEAYARGMKEAYLMGQIGDERIDQNGYAADLSQKQFDAAFKMGRLSTEGKTAQPGEVKIIDGTNAKSMSAKQHVQYNVMEKVAEALNVPINVFASTETKTGSRLSAQGFIKSDGSIYIDLNSGADGRGTMLFTLSHELTHKIRQSSEKGYTALKDFLMKNYNELGKTEAELVAAKKEVLGSYAKRMTDADILEEVICDSCQAMLTDPDVLSKIAELRKTDRTLWEKIVDFIKNVANKLRQLVSSGYFEPDTAEGKYVAQMSDAMEELRDIWTRGVVSATQSTVFGTQEAVSENADENIAETAAETEYKSETVEEKPKQEKKAKPTKKSPIEKIVKSFADEAARGKTTAVRLEYNGEYYVGNVYSLAKVSREIYDNYRDGYLFKTDNYPKMKATGSNAFKGVRTVDGGTGKKILEANTKQTNDTETAAEAKNQGKIVALIGKNGTKYIDSNLLKRFAVYEVRFDATDKYGAVQFYNGDDLVGFALPLNMRQDTDVEKWDDFDLNKMKPAEAKKYSAREKGAVNKEAEAYFGRARSWNETGYLLTDGTKLDFSGRNEGAPGGYRTVDHRDISQIKHYEEYDGTDAMIDFMRLGNIRISPEVAGINLSVLPTKEQERSLSDFISKNRGEVTLDIDDENGDTVVSVEYPRGTYYSKIINDIRNYFEDGTVPQISDTAKFHTQYSTRVSLEVNAEYMELAKDPVKNEAALQKMVDEAAKESGVALDERGKPIHLYHGTNAFGYTEFNTPGIFATSDPSIAAGYGKTGYADKRKISDAYKEGAGLVYNYNAAMNGRTKIREATLSDAVKTVKEFLKSAGEITDKINAVWTSAAQDALYDLVKQDVLPSRIASAEYGDTDFESAFSYIIGLPETIRESLDWAVESAETDKEIISYAKEDVSDAIRQYGKYYENFRRAISDNWKTIKGTDAEKLARVILDYDLSDFAIDAKYGLARALDFGNSFVAQSGQYVSKEDAEAFVEQYKEIGAYDMYGYLGDNPLVIDAKGRLFTNIVVPEFETGDYGWATGTISQEAQKRGYTSVVIKNVFDVAMNNYTANKNGDVYIFFNSNQLKSADPVTYDDNGNVIPLSERFNPENNDIRYSMRGWKPSAEERAEYAQKAQELDDFLKAHPEIQSSGSKQSFYFEINGQKYRVSNHTVESSDAGAFDWKGDQVRELYHGGRSSDTKYIHAASIRLPEIYTALSEGKEVDGRGRVKTQYSTRSNPAVEAAYAALSKELVEENVALTETVNAINDVWTAQKGDMPTKTAIQAAAKIIAEKANALNGVKRQAGKTVEGYTTIKTATEKLTSFYENLSESNVEGAVEAARTLAEELVFGDEMEYNDKVNAMTADILNVSLDTMTLKATSKAVAEIKAKAKDAVEKFRTRQAARQQKAKTRAQISKLADRYLNMLNHAKKGKFIPQGLIKSTVEVLNAINLDTGRSGKSNLERLSAVRSAYEKYNSPDEPAPEYHPFIANLLDRLVENIGETPLYKMDQAQLNEARDALAAMLKYISDADKLFYRERTEDAREAAVKMIQETREAKGGKAFNERNFAMKTADRIDTLMERPKTAFLDFAGGNPDGEWMKAYNDLNQGQTEMTQYRMEAARLFRDIIKGHSKDIDSLSKGKIDLGLKDNKGNEITVPKGFAISLYLSMLNESNARHAAMGGFIVPEFDEYYKGKQDAYSVERKFPGYGEDFVRDAESIKETIKALEKAETNKNTQLAVQLKADLDRMRADLSTRINERVERFMELADDLWSQFSEWDKELITRIQQYYNDYAPERLNEVTKTLFGFEKANVENYFPIWVDKNFLGANYDARNGDYRIVNMGSMQERVVSSKPLILADALDVLAKSINFDSRYVGLAIPLDNFSKRFGIMQGDTTLKEAITQKFGKAGAEYIDRLLKNMNGQNEKDSGAKFRSLLAKSSLMLNVRVMLSQAASFPTAAAVVGYKPLMKALAMGGQNGWIFSKADRAAIEEVSPLLWSRLQGESTIELGDAAHTQNMFRNNRWKWATGWIQAMDAATVGRLFYAAKSYVEDTLGIKEGDKNYKAKLKETYERIIQDTQPNYSAMQRPDILRRGGAIRFLTMFKTQLFQNYNIAREAVMVYNYRRKQAAKLGTEEARAKLKEARASLTRAVSSQLASAATIAGIKFVVDALMAGLRGYRDDDEMLTEKSITAGMLDNMFNSLASSVIGGDMVYNAIKSIIEKSPYYGVDVGILDNINDAVEKLIDVTNLIGSEKATVEKVTKTIYYAAEAVATAFGIPVRNAKKIVDAILRPIYEYAAEKKSFLESHIDRTPSQWSNILYDSIITDNEIWEEKARKELYNHYIESGKTEEEAEREINNTIARELRENDDRVSEAKTAYESGDYKEYDRITKEIASDTEVSSDIVFKAVTGDDSKYRAKDAARAVFDGSDEAADILDYLKEGNEKYAASVKAALTENYKGEYKAASSSKRTEIKRRLWESGLFKKYSDLTDYLANWAK